MLNKNGKINIVMFNMSTYFDWDHGVVNRNYNILQALTKDDRIGKIVAVDFLPIGWKKAVKHYLQNIIWEPKTAEMVYGDLTSACYQKTDKIFVYTTVDSLFSFKKVAKELRKVEKFLNLENIIFWSYNPMFIDFIGKLNEKMFVFDTVDNWTEHPSYTKMISKETLASNYQEIAYKADLIFTVSKELLAYYKEKQRTEDIFWVPNGVDFDHYNNPDLTEKDNILANIDEPIIGYLGTIQERVDLDIIEYLAKTHQDKKIALCGPIWPVVEEQVKDKLEKYDNIIFTNRVSYQDAPSYMQRFDVAIIPHKIDNFINSTNPMKMYEYLACGKPVVTTRGAGIDMFEDILYVTNDKRDFSDFINKALEEDSDEKIKLRKSRVKEHSWKNRVGQMTDKIFTKLEENVKVK